MNAYDLIVKFFKQGGFFLYPIALIWAIGIVIAIERFVYLTRGRYRQRAPLGRAAAAVRGGQLQAGDERRVQQSDTALAQVMKYGLSRITTPAAATTSRRRWRRAWSR